MVQNDQQRNSAGDERDSEELAAHEAERKALEKARDPVDTLSQSGDEDANAANLHYGSRTDEGLTAQSEVNDGAPEAPPFDSELHSDERSQGVEETQEPGGADKSLGETGSDSAQRLRENRNQEDRSASSETAPAAQQVEGGDIAIPGVEDSGSGPVQAAALSVKRGGANEAPFDIELSDTIIDENVSGAKIAELSSSDNDEDATATYSIAKDDSGLFEIVGNELRLKVGASFDFEGQGEYSITLTVTDSDGATYDETFSIAVGDVNEAPEALSLSNATIDENEAGAIVGDLSLADVDAGDSHTYDVDDARFEVVGGQLKLKDGVALDHEAAASVDVTVTATDRGGLSINETFSIAVGDVNEAPEALSLSNATIDENEAGAIVGDLSLADVDAGDSHTYAVDDARFEVVGGQLKLKDDVALDHEAAASVDVTVTATDRGGLSINETFSIAVGDVNEAPEALTLSNATVDENEAGAIVGDLGLTDVDAGDSHTFAVSDNRFEVVGGQLKLKDGVALNHETAASIDVTVTATDSGGLSTSESFSISVGDVNEAPEALTLSNATIDENEAGAIVGDLTFSDVDAGDTHAYSVDDARFEVVGGQLKLKDGVALDHETVASLDVTVTATDSGGLSTNETFSLAVGDVNEAPEALTLSNATVDENEAGAVVGDLALTDVDAGDSHIYAVDDARFEVVGGQLKLKDGVALNHEEVDSIDVTVTATDAGGLSTNETFSIAVGDVNEAPTDIAFTSVRQVPIDNAGFEARSYGDQRWGSGAPGWESSGGSGDWNPAARSLAAEASEGDNVAYVNSGNLAQTVDEIFAQDGEYTLSVDVGNRQDISSFGEYEVRLYAGDELIGSADGGAPAEGGWQTVTLNVDGSDFPADFAGFGENLRIELVKISGGQVNFDNVQLGVTDSGSEMVVPENQPGAQIAVLSASDPDIGDTHTFTISDDRFEIVDNALKLKDGVSLDHEEADSVDIIVTATDADGLSYDENFSIRIGDVNEAPDQLSLSNTTVDENDAGAIVGDLSLSDVDDGDSHNFVVDDARFEVVDGQLKLKDGVSLNHEQADSIDVTVTATDSRGLSTNSSFSIGIGDINEAPSKIGVITSREIEIDNAGFEDRAYSDQRWGSGAPGWESDGGSGDWNPAARSLAAEASEGANVAYINSGGLAQTVDEFFSADSNYELSVDVGNRQDISGFGEYEIRLYAGNELIGAADGGAPVEGGWETVTLNVNGSDLPADFAGFGESLRIELVKIGGGQVNFDNVRLNAVDVSHDLSVDENTPGAVIANLNVIDEDAGDGHTYAVDDARFEIVGNQLKLKDGIELDHEAASNIEVVVTATDSGGLSTNQTFSVAVGDVNEAPESLALSNTTIDENDAGAVIGELSLTDADAGDSHTYAVDDARFEVVGGQLKLKDGVALDHEASDSIDVTVTATDGGGLSTNETFSIAVGDVNEAPEALTLSNTTIDENDAGAIVGDLALTDVDAGDSHTYAVDDARFEVVSGQLKLKDGVGLKNEDAASVDVTVTATDSGGLATEETFTIDVTDHDQVINGSADPVIGDVGQVGTVTVGQASSAQWHSVAFDQPITDAVVVMSGNTQNGSDPFTIRVRNVTENGFEFQIDEWDYLDGYHVTETLSWMAVEEGVHTLENGQTLYAGNENVDSKKAKFDLPDELTDPVVLAQVQSVNEASAVTVRTDIQNNGKVQLYLQEEESIRNKGHVDETVGVIAIDNGGAAAEGIVVGTTGDKVRHTNFSESYGDDFNGVEHALFTNMQTDDGGDTSVSQISSSSDTGFSVHIEEEQSKNSEINHTTEDVGFAAIEIGTLKAITTPGAADLDDTLTGGLGDDTISGGMGNDIIDGAAGDDVLIGGLGDDMISGGDGSDTFIYQMGDGNDIVSGGVGGGWTDVLQLDAGNGDFGDLGADWTISLSQGAVTAQDGDSVNLSDDAEGIITFSDGSTVSFDGIDEIGLA